MRGAPAESGTGQAVRWPRAAVVVALVLAACAAGWVVALGDSALPAPPVDFSRDVRPILAANCFKCHGPDPETRKGKLRLDVREGAVAQREHGVAIAPGDSHASLLIDRIASDDPELRMPPVEVNAHGLSEEQAHTLRRWIDEGATWSEHWSFVPPARRAAPAVHDAAWCRTPLDAWVLAALERDGLRPSPDADRATLLRRVSLDLTGLPPTPGELDAFLADRSADSYALAVERLLNSPHYGEKWARWWLDLARYADTKGYEKDDRRTMWPYRDWVIRVLNADMPFDRFTLEQLAGDMAQKPTTEQMIATGFHRNTMTNDEGGTDDEEFRTAAVIDRVNTTMEVWQGLTMGCAQCHAHKFDPIPHADYYRMFAVFNNTQDSDANPETPFLAVNTAENQRELERLDAAIAEAAARVQPKRDAAGEPELIGPPTPLTGPEAALSELQAQRAKVMAAALSVPVMRELPVEQRRKTHRFVRGSFLNPAEEVTPGVPEAFAGVAPEPVRNRSELAQWLMSERNPLTARVIANRVWEQVFGTGLVETTEDFGTQGAWPSNRELLDELAIQFRTGAVSTAGATGAPATPWSLKALLRQIVTSATYRQSSRVTPDLLALDPYNRLLARGPRFRLDAETLRDQALAVSGLLSEKLYGPPVFPPQPDGLWIMIYSGDKWQESSGDDRHRRALYTFWRRTVPYPSMTTFDAPTRDLCTSRRIRTNTPLQAFVTLNDPAFVECAQAMARRVVAEGGAEVSTRASYALRLAVGRRPTSGEVARIVALVARERDRYAADAAAASKTATVPLGAASATADVPQLAAWTTACSVILNLDEVLTKE